jgi:hypothetical protein
MAFGRMGGRGGFGGLGLLGGASSPRINLSAAIIGDTAHVGDVVGTLSVSRGTGSYTYTFTSNPGTLFSITTNSLKVAASLTAGSDAITLHADNGAGSVVTTTFLITVTHASGAFVPTFELLGF